MKRKRVVSSIEFFLVAMLTKNHLVEFHVVTLVIQSACLQKALCTVIVIDADILLVLSFIVGKVWLGINERSSALFFSYLIMYISFRPEPGRMSVFNNNLINPLRVSYSCKMFKWLAIPTEQHIKSMYILVSI